MSYNRSMPMIVGMDEVGRGSWAGPVMVGAVILDRPIAGLRDSKLLTVKSRETLALQIRSEAFAYAVGQVSHQEIDTLGLTKALELAYERALAGVAEPYDEIIIDGSVNFLASNSKARTIIKADQTVAAVSAASIIAKVTRDQLMAELALKYPGYGFERHVGYGTAFHAASLVQFGPCDIHRRSFAPVRQVLEGAA